MVYLNNVGTYFGSLIICVLLFIACENSSKNKEGISLKDEGNILSFYKGENQILSYQTTGTLPSEEVDSIFLRGGYIHPVFTPSGKIITGDYPSNHVHHHGIWTAWTKTVFEGRSPDFWNMGDTTGTVKFVKVDTLFSTSDFSGFKVTHHYIDLSSREIKIVLEETWNVKVYNNRDADSLYYLFDLDINQKNPSKSPLVLPEYHYGGLGFRGAGTWEEVEDSEFLTSEGKTRENGNETRGRWCHIGGNVEDGKAGITIMNHSDNFRFPQPMRLHPTEPFFCYAPSQLGEWSISEANPYQARYRFVVYDGEPDIELIEKLWQEYNK